MTCEGQKGPYTVIWQSGNLVVNNRTYGIDKTYALPLENAKAVDSRTADGSYHAVFGGTYPRIYFSNGTQGTLAGCR
jgi:hypothetical protein